MKGLLILTRNIGANIDIIGTNLHAQLGNRCSDMFAFPHFLRNLSKLVK